MAFWHRKKRDLLRPEHIGCDIHNHLLPGVDDGIANRDEASQCIEAMLALGYRGAVVTPHINHRSFNTTERTVTELFPPFVEAMKKKHPTFELTLGAEYMMDESLIERVLHQPEHLIMFGPADARCLLVEFNTQAEPLFIDELLTACAKLNVRPIIAHVERYVVVRADQANHRLTQWRAGGAWLQINLGSLAGQFGRSMQTAARRIFEAGLIDILGTDLHSPRQGLEPLAKAWQWLGANATKERFDPGKQAGMV